MTSEGQITTEFAKDESGRLEQAATRAIRRNTRGADDDGQWYPVTYTVANLAFADTRGQYVRPRRRGDPYARSVERMENNRSYLENNGTG